MLRRSIWLMAMAGLAAFTVPAHTQQGITAPVTTLNIGQLPKTSTITNDDLFIKRDANAASGYRTQAVKASDFASYLNTQLGIVSGLTAEIIRAQAAEAANAAAVVTERNRAQGAEGNALAAAAAAQATANAAVPQSTVGQPGGVASYGDSRIVNSIQASNVVIPKMSTSPASAPGTGNARLIVIPGSSSGTCALGILAGTSLTPVIIADYIGSGC